MPHCLQPACHNVTLSAEPWTCRRAGGDGGGITNLKCPQHCSGDTMARISSSVGSRNSGFITHQLLSMPVDEPYASAQVTAHSDTNIQLQHNGSEYPTEKRDRINKSKPRHY